MRDTNEPPFSTSGRGLLPHGPTQRRPTSYPGPVRVRVCRSLGGDWRELAEYLEIPEADRARFTPGHEASDVWDWLDRRHRLGDLATALRALDLSHCADLLDRP